MLSQSGNSYTGATTIQSGLLVAAGGGAIGDASAVSLNNSVPGGNLNGEQAKFHKTDLHLSYSPFDERWTVGLWVKNGENKAQTTQVLPFGRTQITDPRTFGANLGYKF